VYTTYCPALATLAMTAPVPTPQKTAGAKAVSAPVEHKLLSRTVADWLAQRIISGEEPPGTRLAEVKLAELAGVSRSPVREALRLLAAEGVVELVHNRGARVCDWSPQDIDEAYRLRALIEGYGAGLAARRADAACVRRLRVLQDRYEAAVAEGEHSGTSAQCNDDFHAGVLEASGSARLSTLLTTVSSAPLVRRVLQGYSDDDRRRSILQHRDIITAIENGDDELATTAMSSHILAARYTAMGRVPRP
jgi:DNA-binding GntR family transcriptional regulator